MQDLYKILVEELSHYIYIKSSNDVLQWRRAASAQNAFQRASSGRNSSGRASGNMKNETPKAKAITLEIVNINQGYRKYLQNSFKILSLKDQQLMLNLL